MDQARHKADSAKKYEHYFDLMGRKMEEYKIKPWLMYNMDERGFLIGVLTKTKRIFSRRLYEKGELKHIIQDGNREWVTVIACVCADGTPLDPGLIYQSTSGKIMDTWVEDFDPNVHKIFLTASPTGWTNDEIGYKWLVEVFDRQTKKEARSSYRLLILDGHGSHLTMNFMDFCLQNKILVAVSPPHSTHTLQPLDVSVFRPLASAYNNELMDFMKKSQGLTSIKKTDFLNLFYTAWKTSVTAENIRSGFEACGLNPFNPDRVIERFRARSESLASSNDSSDFNPEDWKGMRELLYQIVKDTGDKRVKKLVRGIHNMSVEVSTLRLENRGLRESLERQRRQKQRGKPLDFGDSDAEGSHGQFNSPSKLGRAIARNKEKARQ
ncbi:hypothetical protein VTN49DRAFT_521 [Thermomyces lanuginosus]|uniref:uncharacterized protein n=1 Tax=Thermomyces lanuginosus TaxID=5541 RepID=UPI003742851D